MFPMLFFMLNMEFSEYICSMLLFISGPEIVFVLFIIVVFFGSSKLPEIARGLAKGINQVKSATNEIKHEIQKSAEDNGMDTSLMGDVKKEIDKVKDDFDDLTGPIKRQL